MGQEQILDFLREKRQETDDWFDTTQIREALLNMGAGESAVRRNLYSQLSKLIIHNRVEWKGVGTWNHKKLFRARK